MVEPADSTPQTLRERVDPDNLARQVTRLRRLNAGMRWAGVVLMWMTLGAWSCWEMRESLALLREYFSLIGLQYSVLFHLWGGGTGLVICVAITLSSLLWQIGQWLWQPSDRERHRLEVRVQQIQSQGAKHPFWRWIQVD
jgi:hypothetical protein